MFRQTLAVVLAVACAVFHGACERSESPSGVFAGTWTGTVLEPPRGQGTIRLVLEHKGSTINGTLRTTFQGAVDRDGPVQGVATSGGATLTFVPGQPLNCGAVGTLTGTVTITLTLAAGRLTGSYSQFTCAGAVTAIVDMGMA